MAAVATRWLARLTRDRLLLGAQAKELGAKRVKRHGNFDEEEEIDEEGEEGKTLQPLGGLILLTALAVWVEDVCKKRQLSWMNVPIPAEAYSRQGP